MPLKKIYAHLSCTEWSKSTEWFERLFGREPDACPMDGLAEWHHADNAGFQLYENPGDAGHATLTLIVEGIDAEHERLARAGLEPGPVERADTVHLIRLRDPDGNLVVLAESR
ncbi:MAG: glyoxalase/bleomycin resistance/dioxygenase family protein [Maricaulis sp.]|jgi:catechol 2,3-dioxygenase-like lactoylglutathione lyase family enzyme|nr:glyoxalase/bleomycin resistance/dioxygenase family protein [Maricaulis sp.]HAQ33904.1 glyoxalase/bleomycin resistance/dioxygenase family protein [Alphaproteobacteria bacterium]|tara:strand:- start:117 stop:455 length:339 start_codon:yes stop_codon:yes gene_type:complete